jgi:altronate dehydratase small subunit
MAVMTPSSHDDDPRLLRLDERDNIVIARAALERGDVVQIDGQPATVQQATGLGFKLAAAHCEIGTVIVRAGVPIGQLTTEVSPGDLIHTHNLVSMYLPTHARRES